MHVSYNEWVLEFVLLSLIVSDSYRKLLSKYVIQQFWTMVRNFLISVSISYKEVWTISNSISFWWLLCKFLLFYKWRFLRKPIVEGLDLSRLSLLWEKKDFIKMQINSPIESDGHFIFQQTNNTHSLFLIFRLR